MVRNFAKVFLALSAVVLFCSAIALADKGKSVKIFNDSVLPNGQELKAGEYTVRMNATTKQLEFVKKGKVVAQFPCHCIEKPAKNQRTEVFFTTTKEGKQMIQEIRLVGDTKDIVLEAQGM